MCVICADCDRLLKGVAGQDASYKRRYELMFVALASVAGDTLYQEFRKQEDLVRGMTTVAEKVKAAKDKDVCQSRHSFQVLVSGLALKGKVCVCVCVCVCGSMITTVLTYRQVG